MANEWKAPMAWHNEGVEPSENLKSTGFQAGYKPPAAVFNYFLHNEQECIEQLQGAVDAANAEIATKAKAEHSHTLDDVTETTDKKIFTATEREKLANVAEGANAYTHPTTSGNKHIPSGGSADQILRWSADGTAVWGDEKGGGGGLPTVTATSSDGVAYTGTADGIEALTAGVAVVFVSSKASASTTPTLNINGLGAKGIRRRLSNLASTPQAGYANTWLTANKAFLLVYDGSYWIVDGYTKPASADLYGTVSVEKGGTGATTAAAARTNLEAAPAYTYGTADLTAGTSSLTTGRLYFVYE